MVETITVATGFLVSFLLGFIVIPWLRKLKYGQSIKEIGPVWHKYKEGTPTMGGLMFIAGTLLAVAVGMALLPAEAKTPDSVRNLIVNLVFCLVFAALGSADDIVKIHEHHNDGLTAKQKLAVQILAAIVYTWVMKRYAGLGTEITIPFFGTFDLKWFYYCLVVFSIVGIVNAVNLTDGVDGLASSVTVVVAAGFSVIAYFLMGRKTENVFCLAVIGALLGFLVWNFKPAKVFMGDTGSLFLGGAVVAMAFSVDFQLLMLLSGIVYVCEAFSDIIQFAYFRATHGKRFFKMAPIHHHFEMCGWSEVKIVIVFSLVAAIGTALSVWAASIR